MQISVEGKSIEAALGTSCADVLKQALSGKRFKAALACRVKTAETETLLDLSAEMLALAQKKAEEARVRIRFSEQNIALFSAGGDFDAVICSFDGINYLTSPGDVESCFACVSETLSDDGVFIFDVSTPYKYENILADNAFVYEYDDLFLSWQNYFNKKTGLCDFYLTFFIKNGASWKRYDETQKQRKYALNRLEKMLAEAGLTVVETVSDIDFSPMAEDSDRCFFVCKKAKP
jgi:SAM-dependent methyltransferase